MLSYKEILFVESLDSIAINESTGVNFLDLLLEAPIDDATVKKMIDDKKQVSIYYQGDDKLKKGWYSAQPVKSRDSGGEKYLMAYNVPKDGGKPELHNFVQEKIVNWNVLGKKDADLAKEYDKKIFTFFSDPKIPSAKKNAYRSKLSNIGSKFGKVVLTGLLASTLLGGLSANNFAEKNIHGKALKSFLTLRDNTFTAKDMKPNERQALKDMVDFAFKNPKKYVKGTNVNFYAVANDMNKGGEQIDFKDKGKLGLDQKNLSSEYTKLAMTLGNAQVTENPESYTVSDIYDFNNYKNSPEDYTLANTPSTVSKALKNIGDGNYVQGIEKLASYYHKMGYDGYKVKIVLPK